MLPSLTSLLAAAYLTLHLAVTVAVLLWLHQRRPAAFPFVRTTLLLASGLSLVGFLAYPAAPPRLAGIGIADTVSHGPIDLTTAPPERACQASVRTLTPIRLALLIPASRLPVHK